MFDRLIHPSIGPEDIAEPRWARFLFASRVTAWFWLLVRLYLAYIWLPAGWEKITSGAWLFGDGSPIKGLISGAIADKSTPGWYVTFLQNVVEPHEGLFATLVALGETAVGLALLLGFLTGIAAFFGVLMNATYVLSGVLASNPVLIVLGALVMVAWRNAGWIGLDRWLLPMTQRGARAPAPAPVAAPATTPGTDASA